MLGSRLESVLQSHEEISLDENLEFNVLHMEMPEGGGRTRKFLENAERLSKKRCFIQIIDKQNEQICCARAIVTGIARIERDPHWNSIRQSRNKQRVLAHKLHAAADVPIGPCGIDEIKKFENAPQMNNYRVVLVSKEHCDYIIYAGPEDREHTIYLYSHDNHYDLITKMAAFLERAYFCSTCLVGYDTKYSHKCEFHCNLCLGNDCKPEESSTCYVLCEKCNRTFKNDTCLRNHLQNKVCEKNSDVRNARFSATENYLLIIRRYIYAGKSIAELVKDLILLTINVLCKSHSLKQITMTMVSSMM